MIPCLNVPKTTWLPSWVLRLLPSERYRATVLLILGGIAGYMSPVFVQAVTDRWQFPLEVARIEQLRIDAAHVNCLLAQQVVNEVVQRNQEITRKHTEVELWYTKLFVAGRWRTVHLITVPCEER